MRRKWFLGLAALAVGLLMVRAGFSYEIEPARTSDAAKSGRESVLKTKKDLMSYGLGVETVEQYRRLGVDIDFDLLIRGITDAAKGNETLMSDDDVKDAMVDLKGEIAMRQQGRKMVAALDNKTKGDEFLASNKFKRGVVILRSGLQYKIIKAGEGRKPAAGDTVEVRYAGSLVDGTQFENTFVTPVPLTMKVSDPRVIAGLREALELMPAGSRWQLFIPSKLAYGGIGKQPYIGPNAALIYDIELLAVK
jgi:FKBP-type peptidyl-prolyl cis-trans isomerase